MVEGFGQVGEGAGLRRRRRCRGLPRR
jgi:hypothetical protein